MANATKTQVQLKLKNGLVVEWVQPRVYTRYALQFTTESAKILLSKVGTSEQYKTETMEKNPEKLCGHFYKSSPYLNPWIYLTAAEQKDILKSEPKMESKPKHLTHLFQATPLSDANQMFAYILWNKSDFGQSEANPDSEIVYCWMSNDRKTTEPIQPNDISLPKKFPILARIDLGYTLVIVKPQKALYFQKLDKEYVMNTVSSS